MKKPRIQKECDICHKTFETIDPKKNICKSCKMKSALEGITKEQWAEKYEKRKRTCLEKYGVENPAQSEESKRKSKETNLKKYGKESFSKTEEFREKVQKTWEEKSDEELEDFKNKMESAFLNNLGVRNPMFLEESKEKIKQTCLEKYGVSSSFQSEKQKKKTRRILLEKYGVDNFAKTLEARKKGHHLYEYGGEIFDSKPELAFWIYCKENNKNISRETKEFEYELNGKTHKYYPDFEVDGLLYEIKGNHFLKEDGSWQNPFDHSMDEEYEAKHQCALKNEVNILYEKDYQKYVDWVEEKYTKDFLDLFKVGIPFPYINEDFRKKGDMDVIHHFHKSIYEATKLNKLSPLVAWNNKDLVLKSALNRLKYVGRCKPSDILAGFNVARIAPKISVFKPSLAESLIKKYLTQYNEIFDPFSGFSGRMIGSANCGKTYIGQDIHSKHVLESNEIIQYKGYQNCSVTQQDILYDVPQTHECLFTCPPYGGKEHWNENNDEIEKSCDEWIDICLQKYKCNTYLFVVDETEKYKDKIVDTITNKSHFGIKNEYVILLNRN